MGLGATVSRNIVARNAIVELACKAAPDDRKILVQRIVGGVKQCTEHTVDYGRIPTSRYMAVYSFQFCLIRLDILEDNSFGVKQEQDVQRLGQRFKRNCHIRIQGQ